MALSKTVTKVWPSLAGDTRTYSVGIHLILQDDGVTTIDRDFVATYGGAGELSVARDAVLRAAQAAVSKYKSEKAIYDAASYTVAVSYIDSNLIL